MLKTDPGPDADWNEVTPNLGWLLLGSIFAATLLNAGPIAAGLLAEPDQDALVSAFSYGVLLARIPLFLFQAVQAALLPRLSRLAARGELLEFRAGLKRLIIVVMGIGVIGIAGALLLGTWVIDLVYDADLSGRTMAMLVVQQRLLHDVDRHRPSGDRPQGPRAGGGRLGRRRRHLPARRCG